jgi:hypothetical protein
MTYPETEGRPKAAEQIVHVEHKKQGGHFRNASDFSS